MLLRLAFQRIPRRSFQTGSVLGVPPETSHDTTESGLRESLRELLRHTAQPVSVLTVRDPANGELHGATLSSFSSISFQPFPIVCFALQLPSRSANALQSHYSSTDRDSTIPQLTLNILSASQSDIAIKFSRPDLYSEPFRDMESQLSLPSPNLPPAFNGAVGSLGCTLISCVPLSKAAGGSESLSAALGPQSSTRDVQGVLTMSIRPTI